MVEQNMTDKSEEILIPLKAAVEKYGADAENILNWAENGEITASRIGETWFVDEESIRTRINLNKKISAYNTKLAKRVKEKEKLIRKFDNDLFIIKNLYDLTPAFQLVLFEMAKLIPFKENQAIFLDMMIGEKDMDTIAENYGMTVDVIMEIQEANVHIIQAKSGFLQTYQDRLDQLTRENQELDMIGKNKTKLIKKLSSMLPGK